MRSKPIKAVDPDKFHRAFHVLVKGIDEPLPATNGFDIEHEDGSVQSFKLNDHPMTRALHALAKALPNLARDEHFAIVMRFQALAQITQHPAMLEFVRRGKTADEVSNYLIRAAAICPLRKTFLPSQLLRTIRSFSEAG